MMAFFLPTLGMSVFDMILGLLDMKQVSSSK